MPKSKQRGRPRNASWRNPADYAALERVADCLVAEPGLKYPTTAMRRIGIDSPTDHKRLLSKWKPVADRFMRDAQARRAAARYKAFMDGVRRAGDFLLQVGRAVDRAATVMTERYIHWAEENPQEAENLKRAMLNLHTFQIEAKPQRG